MRVATRTLVVEARHLDTDDRTVSTVEVEMPVDEVGQRAQLAELVAGLHPGVRMRSFGGGAASFLGAEHLVVAQYVGADHDREGASGEVKVHQPAQQQSLFAA
jgi:hypothetical protein